MIGRMLKRDFLRNKVITITLFAFMMLSALLISSAATIIINLFSSMDKLFTNSHAPHFVQMHTGELDQRSIDHFVLNNSLVKKQQTVEMIRINGSNIFLHDRQYAENDSVMDISFVKQNSSFDYLLNLESRVIEVEQGEVGVPIYYMQHNNLKIGDKIWIADGDFEMEFKIAAFVRDVQMNPSIVSSKRFVIHDADWKKLKSNLGEREYLIEFQLKDLDRVNEFQNMYQSSQLPQQGTAITYSLYKTLNALSDGILAVVIIFISFLLITIAILCIRFTLITTMEEDYREIGVMKAIGISNKDIQKLYLIKYIVMTAIASIFGYILSLFVSEIFLTNIALYMGSTEKNILYFILPFMSTIVMFITVVIFCKLILRKFRYVTSIEAVYARYSSNRVRNRRMFVLYKSRFPYVNLYLGMKDVFERFKIYGLLCLVFIISTFIIIVPINFLQTVQSPKFITYMGVGKSDIRIDLQQSEQMGQRFSEVISYIERDNDVEKYAAFVTSTFKVMNHAGVYENMNVETGNFTVFPLKYLKGSAPQDQNEIALSQMNANELKKNVGDVLILIVNGKKMELTVCGIYQDVTNGGKTAKARVPYDSDRILWHVLNLDMKSDVDKKDKMEEYKQAFYPAKVMDMEDYLSQTLGGTIDQLKLVTGLAIVIAIAIVVLIAAMFFKMLIAKDSSQIIIMKSLGFSYRNIQVQYITRAILISLIGIVLGTFMVGTLGEKLASGFASFMGASNIQFVINPAISYIFCPLSLVIAVTITTFISSMTMKNTGDLKRIGD